MVGIERAAGAGRLVVGTEHEVVDQQLRAPAQELLQRPRPLGGLEEILLVDPYPRQLAPLACELIAHAGQLLLALEQLHASSEPLRAGVRPVCRHRVAPLFAVLAPSRCSSAASASSRAPVPRSRWAGVSWPSRNAPCSVKISRVPAPVGSSSTVASETEIRCPSRCMS